MKALRDFLFTLEIAAFDEIAAELSGSLRAWLVSQGTPIGPYDTLIAAHAHAIGATLVSNNTPTTIAGGSAGALSALQFARG
jgi:tRNA(fMet)-specific endonuclease VapC